VFRRLFSRKQILSGTPAIRRLKTYSAQTGYVYHYFFEGHREFSSGRGESGREFVFSTSADRKIWNETRVFLSSQAVNAWQEPRLRQLSSTERYAIAKMALFQAFDSRPLPADMSRDVHIDVADIEAIVEVLGL
jgi:hypothetical protein